MADDKCRLRKYKRKKAKARTIEDFDRYTVLYYRYVRKVFGPRKYLRGGTRARAFDALIGMDQDLY